MQAGRSPPQGWMVRLERGRLARNSAVFERAPERVLPAKTGRHRWRAPNSVDGTASGHALAHGGPWFLGGDVEWIRRGGEVVGEFCRREDGEEYQRLRVR